MFPYVLAQDATDAAAAAAATGMLAGWGIFIIIWWIIALAAFIFWVVMLIDVIKRTDWKDSNEKTLWIILVIVLGVIGALAYLFVIKMARKSQTS